MPLVHGLLAALQVINASASLFTVPMTAAAAAIQIGIFGGENMG